MKIIIAGSRNLPNLSDAFYFDLLDRAAAEHFPISEVVSGKARGGDAIGERWANLHRIPIKFFPADWSIGKHAGILRNTKMGNYADGLIALWDGQSKGIKHMIDYARNKGLTCFIAYFQEGFYTGYNVL